MATPSGHECFHCKQWIPSGQEHDCWTTTEAALTRNLDEDLREAWERIRESAVELGEQRIYASHHSIMFARRVCYFFVRPKKAYLEVCVFLGRAVKHPLVHKAENSSAAKTWHLLRIVHRDQVEEPMTDWLREAYEFADPERRPSVKRATRVAKPKAKAATPKAKVRSAKKKRPVRGA
jgi:hypothetical protein